MYGIFNGQKLTGFRGCETLESLGKRYLRRIMKEEGLEWTKAGILKYLESWCDWSQETDEPCNDPELMIDQAVSTLAYSNIHFMQIESRCQISSAEREIVRDTIQEQLYLPFNKK